MAPMLEPFLVDDLADDELRARLVQHGATVDEAVTLVEHREDPMVHDAICAILDDQR